MAARAVSATVFIASWVFSCVVPIAVAPPQAGAASEPAPAVIRPARDGLAAVPLPRLESFDPAVVRQFESVQGQVAATLARPEAADEDVVNAYGLLGQLHHAYEILDTAAICYRNASSLAPRDYRWLHLLGVVLRSLGSAEEALRYQQLALAEKPGDVASLIEIGELNLELARLEQAAAAFRGVLEIDPSSPAAHAGLGKLALAGRDYSTAVKELEMALAAVPAASRLHYSLAMAYRGLGQTEKARSHLQASGPIGLRAPDPLIDGLQDLLRGERVHLLRGRLAFAFGRYQEAAEEFEAAVEADPASVRSLVNLGSALGKLGDNDAAVEHLRKALTLDPDNVIARFNLGQMLLITGQPAAAIEHLEAASLADSEDAQTHLLLARAHVAAGRPEASLAGFKKAAALDPLDEAPLLGGAAALVNLGRFAEAISVLEAGHRRMPEQGRIAHTLAYLLAACPDPALRDGARALSLGMRVYNAAPLPEHASTVALALAEGGRCSEAAEWQSKAIAILESTGSSVDPSLQEVLARYRSSASCRPPIMAPSR